MVPHQLRAIPTADLSANVLVDGVSTTYYGREYPTGNWTIVLNVTPSQEYDMFIQWMASDILVMEQYGNFTAEISDPPIVPVLNSVSQGAARFDDDCDGESNLEEILDGTSPTEASDPLQDGCNISAEIPPSVDELGNAFIDQNSPRFDTSGLTGRLVTFSQPIRVQNINTGKSSDHRVTLFSSAGEKAYIELTYDHLNDRKQVRMSNRIANTLVPTIDSSCDLADSSCTIEFDWKEQHWYELVFVEASNTSWQSWIVDSESGERTLIATALTEPDIIWIEPDIGVGYKDQIPARECIRGIPAITTHFQGGLANRSIRLGMPISINSIGSCVQWGGGGGTDVVYENGNTIYSITVGN